MATESEAPSKLTSMSGALTVQKLVCGMHLLGSKEGTQLDGVMLNLQLMLKLLFHQFNFYLHYDFFINQYTMKKWTQCRRNEIPLGIGAQVASITLITCDG